MSSGHAIKGLTCIINAFTIHTRGEGVQCSTQSSFIFIFIFLKLLEKLHFLITIKVCTYQVITWE